MLAPVATLLVIVAIALGGRWSGGPLRAEAVSAAESPPVAAALAPAPSEPVTAATPRPSLALRSDWPAAINPRAAGRHVAVPALLDERAEWSKDAAGRTATGSWVRRLGAMANYRTDPYER